MPSCVIKNCRNKSSLHTKHAGVSFHKFPRDRVIKHKWTTIIRKSRNDEKWVPSKFSTVCSAHFEEKDLYFTDNGLQRVRKNVVPKKNISRSQLSESILQSSPDSPGSQECPSQDSENSRSSDSTATSKLEPAIQILIPEPSELAGTSEMSECNELPTSHETSECNKLQSSNESNELPDENSVSESEIDSVIEGSYRVCLEKELRKHKRIKLENNRKIKTLNQKVRRLKRKNKSLKTILKGIKDKYLIDPKIEKVPTLNEVPLELFRNIYVNRKKKIHYSPAIRKFCLTLNSYSSKAYEYVREVLNSSLPHPKTLPKWNDIIISETGTTPCANKEKQKEPDDFSSEDDYTTEIPEHYLPEHQYTTIKQTSYSTVQHNLYPTIQENYPNDQQVQYTTEQQHYSSKPHEEYPSKRYDYPTAQPVP